MKTKPVTIKAPAMNADGSCPECAKLGGWICAFHKAENARRDAELSTIFRQVSQGFRASEIARVCSMHELEGDEFQTREEKAERILSHE